MIEKYESLVKNWNNLATEKIDDTFYFDQKTFSPEYNKDSDPKWFRVLLYKVEDYKGYRNQLKDKNQVCLLRLGVSKEKETPYFSPFLQFTKQNTNMVAEEKLFSLTKIDHMEEDNEMMNFYFSSKVKDGSNPIPKKFAKQLMHNWLVSSPADMADHFKAVVEKNGIPSIASVKYYIFNSNQNFEQLHLNSFDKIQQVYVSMGLNLNNKNTELPTFAPILIYELGTSNSDNAVESGTPTPPYYFEDLANPCPSTCIEDS
jgi:hypothetical protein